MAKLLSTFAIFFWISLFVFPGISTASTDAENLSKQGFSEINSYHNATGGLALINQALDAEPDNPNIWYTLGCAYKTGLKDYDSAIEPYKKSLELDPTNAETKSALIDAIWKGGRFEELESIEEPPLVISQVAVPEELNVSSARHTIQTRYGPIPVLYQPSVASKPRGNDIVWYYSIAIENPFNDTIFLNKWERYVKDKQGAVYTRGGESGPEDVQFMIKPGDHHLFINSYSDSKITPLWCGGSAEFIYSGKIRNESVRIPISFRLTC